MQRKYQISKENPFSLYFLFYLNYIVSVIGQFLKQTTHGWDHQVMISVKEEVKGRSLNWGFVEKTMTKSLSMSAIEKVETTETNGECQIKKIHRALVQ